MKIAITGTPCVGKSTVSDILSRKLGYKLVKINNLAHRLNAYSGYDKKTQSKILDMKKIEKEIRKIRHDVILDGHVSHEFLVDIVIVLRCDPKILEKRLKEKYPKNSPKVKENVEAEILGVITSESIQKNKNVFEVDISKMTSEQAVESVLSIIKTKNNRFKVGKIDWLEKYESWL